MGSRAQRNIYRTGAQAHRRTGERALSEPAPVLLQARPCKDPIGNSVMVAPTRYEASDKRAFGTESQVGRDCDDSALHAGQYLVLLEGLEKHLVSCACRRQDGAMSIGWPWREQARFSRTDVGACETCRFEQFASLAREFPASVARAGDRGLRMQPRGNGAHDDLCKRPWPRSTRS